MPRHNITNPSYPTQSLRFLQHIKGANTQTAAGIHSDAGNSDSPQQALVRLNIIVVGAGLGGLAAAIALARRGHTVTVLEQAPVIGEVFISYHRSSTTIDFTKVGAGIQIPSNSSRILLGWGIGEFIGNKVVEPEGMSFLRWQDGAKIGYTKLVPDFRENFGAPYYVVHRADFHDALYRCAMKLGVTLHVDSRVDTYDADSATVRTANGLSYTGDLVVAADGKTISRYVY